MRLYLYYVDWSAVKLTRRNAYYIYSTTKTYNNGNYTKHHEAGTHIVYVFANIRQLYPGFELRSDTS